MRLTPVLSEQDQRRVTEHAITLVDPPISQPAREVERCLIVRVPVGQEDGQAVVALDGTLTALVGLAQNAKSPAVAGPYESFLDLAAGARLRRNPCALGADI
ncbi:hypothetical protein [Fuscovulum ytuae]|uniref:Uncharacterized protein n=1 Tax=Fuscovulum ytuae TaxID=3042299 RepID=A0ABY8Q9E5_9RHOB|nr:hypothetical protein [Fuscovulum sp. YMD61]WGV17313.1 hypothetical protein QF092_05780 [Fuscovulum sp. YMD61]